MGTAFYSSPHSTADLPGRLSDSVAGFLRSDGDKVCHPLQAGSNHGHRHGQSQEEVPRECRGVGVQQTRKEEAPGLPFHGAALWYAAAAPPNVQTMGA